MKFNLTVDKRAEAVIDGRLCVNCGKCGQVCPAEAVDEYRRTVYCMFPDCRDENGADGGAGGAGGFGGFQDFDLGDIFGSMFGGGFGGGYGGGTRQRTGPQKGENLRITLQLTFE